MSKRHQASRRKTLRPPPARAARAEPARPRAGRSRPPAPTSSAWARRPTGSPSWTRARPASATRSAIDVAVYQGARQRTIVLPRRPRVDVPTAPTIPRRRMRSAVRAHRGPSRLALLLAAIVIAFAGAFLSLSRTSACRRPATRPTASRPTSSGCRRRLDLRNESTGSARRRPSASSRIEAGLGQLPEPEIIPAR